MKNVPASDRRRYRLTLEYSGTGYNDFLWKMVRRMAGVLVEVGKGHLPVDEVADFSLNGLFTIKRNSTLFRQKPSCHNYYHLKVSKQKVLEPFRVKSK